MPGLSQTNSTIFYGHEIRLGTPISRAISDLQKDLSLNGPFQDGSFRYWHASREGISEFITIFARGEVLVGIEISGPGHLQSAQSMFDALSEIASQTEKDGLHACNISQWSQYDRGNTVAGFYIDCGRKRWRLMRMTFPFPYPTAQGEINGPIFDVVEEIGVVP